MRAPTPILTLLVACGGEPSLETTTGHGTTNNGGQAEVDFHLDGKADAFLLTAVAETGLLSVEYVTNHRGQDVLSWEDLYDSSDSLTGAIYSESTATQINWPVRADDGKLHRGDWSVSLGLVDDDYNYLGGVAFDWTLQVKHDPDFKEGLINITVAYADGLEDDAEVSAAVEGAVSRWEEIWGDYGLSLSVTWTTADLPGDLSFEDGGLKEVAAKGSNRDVLVVIGESIESDPYTYGYAGGIPGTLVATDYAAIYASWLANAGGDGSFSDDDVRLFGETLAHEVGHYTGLFHPVEDGWEYWDALSDTAHCASADACESKLGDNLMFPYTLCDTSGCLAQDQLTGDQEGVMQRYTGAL